MKILNEKQIRKKITRLAIELIEQHFDEQRVTLIGVNNKGLALAKLLRNELGARTDIKYSLGNIRLNPAAPLGHPITLDLSAEYLQEQMVVLVDDVANTGRTLFYACKPLLEYLPRGLETVVLVDRKHKSFPIKVDYVGLSLATTLKENIEVIINETDELAVFLA